jgi:DNA invertase Pin-like site-specific DNA recombinase
MKGKTMDVGLARVSTRDQNPALQITALEQAGCDAIYEEKASGVAKARPVRDQVLAQLQPGDRLSVWKLDRLGRSVIELKTIVDDLDRRGVGFRVLTQPIDTTTAGGRLFFDMLAAFAAFEREMIRERTLAGKARQRADGKLLGPIPFGWSDADTVDQDQADLLREAARRLLDGETMGRVVDDLNARGLRPGKATRWRASHLRRLLLNPSTAKLLGDGDATALARVLATMERAGRGKPAEHLLSGILTCPCGQPLYAAKKAAKAGSPPQSVYRCKKGDGSGGRFAGCGRTQVAQGRADDYALEMFIASATSDAFAQALAQRQAELLGDVDEQELDDWRAEIVDLENVPARFAPPDAKERLAQLQRMVRDATGRLMAQPQLQAMLDLPRSEEALRSRWSSWTVAERRSWLRRLVERIEVLPAGPARGPRTDVESRMVPIFRM